MNLRRCQCGHVPIRSHVGSVEEKHSPSQYSPPASPWESSLPGLLFTALSFLNLFSVISLANTLLTQASTVSFQHQVIILRICELVGVKEGQPLHSWWDTCFFSFSTLTFYLLLAARGLPPCCAQSFSRCGKWGLLSSRREWASGFGGFPCWGARAPGPVGLSRCSTRDQYLQLRGPVVVQV